MNKHQGNEILLQRDCACGCGKKFKTKYKWHIYFETKCRVKAWHQNQEEKNLEKRIEKLEEQLKASQADK